MNEWGIMVDVSHPSKASMMQAIALSKAPIIASHSAVRALADHSRNMDDEQLLALKKNGGVVQVVAFARYVKARSAASATAALDALREEFGLPRRARRAAAAAAAAGAAAAAAPRRPQARAAARGARRRRAAAPACSVEQPARRRRGGRGGGGGRGAAARNARSTR